jgi:hypothetical protein
MRENAEDDAAAAERGEEAEVLCGQGAEQTDPDQFEGVDQGGLCLLHHKRQPPA